MAESELFVEMICELRKYVHLNLLFTSILSRPLISSSFARMSEMIPTRTEI